MNRPKPFDPMKARGIQSAPSPLEHAKRKASPTGREADPRRTIPLNSTHWRKLRAAVLAREPLCRRCGDVANTVDHASGDPSDNSPANLAPMCAPCHSHKTVRERAGLPVNWGCDANGWPRDPSHPWNASARARRKPWEFTGKEDEKSPEGEATKTARIPSFHR